MTRSGLLIDWGGVLTTSLFRTFSDFCERERLDPKAIAAIFSGDDEARRMLVEFECGRLEERAFEIGLAQRLGVSDEGLTDRLFEGLGAEPAIIEAVVAVRRAGVRTGLLSNSWGGRYDRSRWNEMFDVLVISGEIGIRKPDPKIYELAADRLGLPPEEIVFVDDIPHNLEPAEQAGMATVHHTDPATTIARLEELLGVEISAGRP
jgi:epoxide hydrolase-like predicted phosphatase